jgi:hypothetical protein
MEDWQLGGISLRSLRIAGKDLCLRKGRKLWMGSGLKIHKVTQLGLLKIRMGRKSMRLRKSIWMNLASKEHRLKK